MNDLANRRGGAKGDEAGGFGGALTRLARLFAPADVPQETQVTPVPSSTQAPRPTQARASSPRENMLHRTLDALHTPVVVLGDKLLVAHANEEARILFGDQIVGRNFRLFLREPRVLDEIEDTLDDGQQRQLDVNLDVPLKRQYRLRLSRMDGTLVVLEFQETTLIRRSETMRSDFVANVSHELRSPLATLIGFIETLRDESENPEDASGVEMNARFLGIMEGEAQRMRRLIDDLLSLTNVELREHERPRGRVDIKDVLREVVDSLGPRAETQGLIVDVSCAQGLPHTCGDRDQLIQVFHNLITNAIKYGADGERVEVTAMTCAGGLPDGTTSLDIHVRDFGQGMEAEHLPRLTERFYRVDKGRSRAVGGTGLGLAIVKHIVNRHRGRFSVDSTPGAGSVFKVRLPLYGGDANPIQVPHADAINS